MAKRKTIQEMTRKEFDAVPLRKNWSKSVDCDCLVILPLKRMHDSGYRCMDFVAVRKGRPICRLSGCSDVIHFDGISGEGWRPFETTKTGSYKLGDPVRFPHTWNIDCLLKSGLLNIFVHGAKIRCGSALSSFCIYAVRG